MRNWKGGWSAGVIALVAMSMLATTAPPADADNAKASRPDLSKYTDQSLKWDACAFDSPGPKIECALMTVPRDWAAPNAGPDLQVQVSRVAATGKKADRQGVVMTNPGGPGGAGADLPATIAELQPDLNQRFDILGMNPRGVGQTGPASEVLPQGMVTCDVPTGRLPEGPLDARDRSAKSIKEHQKIPRAVAEACQSEAVAPYITTWQTSHDMDLLRQLVKEPKLNYIGYSYGTWLGAKYASLFPKHTGRFVLDSSVDWQGRLMADFEDFPRMGQRQTKKVFLPWLTRLAPKVFGKTTSEAEDAIERGRKAAIAQGIEPDTYDALFVGNGSQLGWVNTYLVLGTLITGRPMPTPKGLSAADAALLDRVARQRFGVPADRLTPKAVAAGNLGQPDADSDYSKLPMTRYAVACGDQPTKSTAWYKRLSDKQGPKYPYGGWQYGLTETCGPWSDKPLQKLPKMPESVRGHILVVQGEFDAQTSYEQAMKAVSKADGVNVLRVDDSPFHGQYAIEGNYCVDGVVNNYLINASAASNTKCSSVPLPLETKIHPVKGPVDAYSGAQHMSKQSSSARRDQDQALSRQLGEQISRQNGPQHH